jgi:hypothetical protein
MREKDFSMDDTVIMKKSHPCGTNRWKIIRLGADIRIKCEGCGHSVLMPRSDFIKKVKGIVKKKNDETPKKSESRSGEKVESIRDEKENGQLREKYKEQSDLRKLGYRITGLNRDQRWKLLVSTVLPKIGLKKTAIIISSHIRNRKLQANGEEKFAFAIKEWQHDLEKLKNHFHKNDFNWPTF